MLTVLGNGLVVAGGVILVSSLIPVRRLIAQLPPGSVRRRWYLLLGLTVAFITGYLGFLIASWGRPAGLPELIVPAVFFFGACFVWLTFGLSLQTAIDMRRVTLLELENITDSLTGLHNRRYLDRRLEEEYARVQRYAIPVSILLMDVDRFKDVNDTCGHQAGDLLLSQLGKLIQATVRASDVAARYGGDEILVIAVDTPALSAATLAERLRQQVEGHQFALNRDPDARGEQQVVHVTLSIGVAGSGPDASSVQDLVQRADEALYRAKHEGRNRVVVNNPLQLRRAG